VYRNSATHGVTVAITPIALCSGSLGGELEIAAAAVTMQEKQG